MSSINSNTNNTNNPNTLLRLLPSGGYNYNEWSKYTSVALRSAGVWSDVMNPFIDLDEYDNYVVPEADDGTEQTLDEYLTSQNKTAEELLKHKNNLNKAQNIIADRVDSDVIQQLELRGGARMWHQIEQLCNQTNQSDIPRYCNELIDFHMNDTDTIAQHKQKFNKVLSNVVNAGVDIDPKLLNVFLKNSFKTVPYYNQRVREISNDEMRNKDLYDTQRIFSLMSSAESSRNSITNSSNGNRITHSRSDNTISNSTALYVGHNNNNNGIGSRQRSYNSNSSTSNNNRVGSNNVNQQQGNGGGVKCDYCISVGRKSIYHAADRCWVNPKSPAYQHSFNNFNRKHERANLANADDSNNNHGSSDEYVNLVTTDGVLADRISVGDLGGIMHTSLHANTYNSSNSNYSSTSSQQQWVMDSGCTIHMTGDKQQLSNYKLLDSSSQVKISAALGKHSYAKGIGSKVFNIVVDGISSQVVLNKVLHVENMPVSLFGVHKYCRDNKYSYEYSNGAGNIVSYVSGVKKIVVPGVERNGLVYVVYNNNNVNNNNNSNKQFMAYSHVAHSAQHDNVVVQSTNNNDVSTSDTNTSSTATSNTTSTSSSVPTTSTSSIQQLTQLHSRLGHISLSRLQHMIRHKCVEGLSDSINIHNELSKLECQICEQAKHRRSPFTNHSTTVVNQPLQVIHCDIGEVHTPSVDGNKYYVVFIDEYSGYVFAQPMKYKSQVYDIFIQWITLVQNQTGHTLKSFRCDNASELTSQQFKDYFIQHGILYQLTQPYSPQMNGRAERWNYTLMNIVRAMLYDSQLPDKLWAAALHAGVYILNRIPNTASGNITPIQKFMNNDSKPDITFIKRFGCVAYVHDNKPDRSKLDPRAYRFVMAGYATNSKAYILYDPTDDTFITSRDVTFHEQTNYYDQPQHSNNNNDINNTSDNVVDTHPVGVDESNDSDYEHSDTDSDSDNDNNSNINNNDNNNDIVHNTRQHNTSSILNKSQPTFKIIKMICNKNSNSYVRKWSDNKPNDRINESKLIVNGVKHPALIEWENQQQSHNNNESSQLCLAQSNDIQQYNNNALIAEHVFLSSHHITDNHKYADSIKAEMNSIIANNTFEEVDKPIGKNIIGSRFVHRDKYDENGQLTKHKSRLVAQGYTQKYGIDYTETFAAVMKMITLRIILSIVAILDLECHQMDVATAFLNGELSEEIYMKPPVGYGTPGKVWKLKKSLYGLKQAPKVWYEQVYTFLISLGFSRVTSDWGVFVIMNDNIQCIIGVYVDDIVIACNNKTFMLDIKHKISIKWRIEDLGEIHYILGIKVTRDRKSHTLTLSQEAYIDKMLNEYQMMDCKPNSTPCHIGVQLSSFDCPQNDNDKLYMKDKPYASAVGSIAYLVTATRPDCAYSLSQLAKYMHNPGHKHWTAVKHLLRYLNGTKSYQLVLGGGNDITLYGYCDASYGDDVDNRRSTSGYVYMIGNGVVSYKSKLQPTVATSTCHAEYTATYYAAQESMFLRQLLSELGYKQQQPTLLYNDNQGSVTLAHNPSHHPRTKHIDIKYHWIREQITNGSINLQHCDTSSNIADIMTKSLGKNIHNQHVHNLNLLSSIMHSSGSVKKQH